MLLVKFEAKWIYGFDFDFDVFGFGVFDNPTKFAEYLNEWKKMFKPATIEQAKEYFEVTKKEELKIPFEEVKEEFDLETDDEVLMWLADELGTNKIEIEFGTNECISFDAWWKFEECFFPIDIDRKQIDLIMDHRPTLGIFPLLHRREEE